MQRCLLVVSAPWGLLPRNPLPWRWVDDGRKASASWRSRLKRLCYECDRYAAELYQHPIPQAALRHSSACMGLQLRSLHEALSCFCVKTLYPQILTKFFSCHH